MSLYQITVEDEQNNPVLLEKYKGNVLLIVNTATACIFTPQYSALQSLYEKYQSKGFEILDFPCNQFANQNPGTAEEIKKFCADKYSTTFPRFAKIMVNGPDESILYAYLKKEKHGLFGSAIKWNFTKFLVDKNGKIVRRYAPNTKPEKMQKDIEKIL